MSHSRAKSREICRLCGGDMAEVAGLVVIATHYAATGEIIVDIPQVFD